MQSQVCSYNSNMYLITGSHCNFKHLPNLMNKPLNIMLWHSPILTGDQVSSLFYDYQIPLQFLVLIKLNEHCHTISNFQYKKIWYRNFH